MLSRKPPRLALVCGALLGSALTGVSAATLPAAPVDAVDLLAPLASPQPVAFELARATSRGGALQLIWNDALLRDMDMRRRRAQGTIDIATLTAQSTLDIDLQGHSVRGIAGGSGQLESHIPFALNGRNFEWSSPELLVRPGEKPRIDLRNVDGTTWFYIDTVMYTLLDQGRTFSIRSADLHIGTDLARLLGNPRAADLVVAEVKLTAPIAGSAAADTESSDRSVRSCSGPPATRPNWPGKLVDENNPNGPRYQADVFLKSFTTQYIRCGICDSGACVSGGCDGPGPADGRVVFAPAATLINNRNRPDVFPGPLQTVDDPNGISSAAYSADVPWVAKFIDAGFIAADGSPYYDQHPYLIWNLYRRNADGSITQIGRSGVKHAFLTTNQNPGIPGETCENCNGSYVLGRACSDTYGVSNNDGNSDLGPRREIVPATARWGRCGSIYDQIGACGAEDTPVPNTDFENRMLVRESDLLAAGATYLFESWYVVRDDVNIYNTMGTHEVRIAWNGLWSISDYPSVPQTPYPYRLGPAIDRWVEPTATDASHANSELNTDEGHAKVAVRVTDNGNGSWRYDYAVMNLDFARAVTSGSAPNLSVLRNHGFNRFTVARNPAASVSQLSYDDGDDSRPDWDVAVDANSISWTAADDSYSLDWGVMTRFSFVSSTPPIAGDATLGITEPGSPAQYSVASLAPGPSNAHPPSIADQSFNVIENSPVGNTIGQVVASDPDNDALSYAIVAGDPDQVFAFDENSGVLRVAARLDFESHPQYLLTVEVSDGVLSSAATITVNVTDYGGPLDHPPDWLFGNDFE